MSNSRIPSIGKYRGVRIHDGQPSDRVAHDVKPAIDSVHALDDVGLLARFAADAANAPEARLLAAAKCEASWELCADERRVRPDIDLDKIRATVAGLDDVTWRDPDRYGSLLDIAGEAVRRVPPLDDSTPQPLERKLDD